MSIKDTIKRISLRPEPVDKKDPKDEELIRALTKYDRQPNQSWGTNS